MDLAFGDLREKVIVVYLDNLVVFSKKRDYHFNNLIMVFEPCRFHGISPSIFAVTEGKLLDRIVSKEGR